EVVVQSSATGTQTGEFFGIPATGKPIGYESLEFKWFQGGKVEKTILFMNPATMMRQIGAFPGGPAPLPEIPDAPEIVQGEDRRDDVLTVRAYFSAIASGDFAKIKLLIADNVVVNNHLVAQKTSGIGHLIQSLATLHTAFPNYAFKIEEVFSVAPFVVARG